MNHVLNFITNPHVGPIPRVVGPIPMIVLITSSSFFLCPASPSSFPYNHYFLIIPRCFHYELLNILSYCILFSSKFIFLFIILILFLIYYLISSIFNAIFDLSTYELMHDFVMLKEISLHKISQSKN